MKKKSVEDVTEKDFALDAFEYLKLKKDAKDLDARIKKVRERIDRNAKEFVRLEPSGHKEWVGEHAGTRIRVQYQKKITATLVPEADELLEMNGLKEEYVEKIEQINITKLEIAIKEKAIPASLITELYQTKESFSLIIKAEVGGGSEEPAE